MTQEFGQSINTLAGVNLESSAPHGQITEPVLQTNSQDITNQNIIDTPPSPSNTPKYKEIKKLFPDIEYTDMLKVRHGLMTTDDVIRKYYPEELTPNIILNLETKKYDYRTASGDLLELDLHWMDNFNDLWQMVEEKFVSFPDEKRQHIFDLLLINLIAVRHAEQEEKYKKTFDSIGNANQRIREQRENDPDKRPVEERSPGNVYETPKSHGIKDPFLQMLIDVIRGKKLDPDEEERAIYKVTLDYGPAVSD